MIRFNRIRLGMFSTLQLRSASVLYHYYKLLRLLNNIYDLRLSDILQIYIVCIKYLVVH